MLKMTLMAVGVIVLLVTVENLKAEFLSASTAAATQLANARQHH